MKNYLVSTAAWCMGVILLIIVIPEEVNSQTYNRISEPARHYIDSAFKAMLKKYKVEGASIAIVDQGDIVYSTGYGFSDKAGNVAATDATIYRIGSCTKAFTSLSVMQLQEKGKLDIRHSVKKYLPDLTISSRFNDGNEIFINEIMAHTSGLPGDIINGFFCDSPPDMKWLIGELNKHTTAAPRLYMHAYSNVGYGLLGEVIARVSGKSYNDYIHDAIFKPLGMNSSYVDVDPDLKSRFSKGYINGKEMKEPLIRDQAAGLIHSTVIDMGRFINCLLNEGKSDGTNIVSAASLSEMKANQLGNTLLSKDKNWGYGLYTEQILVKSKTNKTDSTVMKIVGHGGDTYAYHADFGFIPELNTGVIILTNTDRGPVVADASRLLKWYLEKEKGKSVKLNYRAKDTVKVQEGLCTVEEIKGLYPVSNILVKVDNTETIRFKQGPVKIKLFHKSPAHDYYSAKAFVFGLIPINMKDLGFRFVKVEEKVYLKQMDLKTNRGIYAAVKTVNPVIPDAWKQKYGTYVLTGTYYRCEKCVIGNPEGLQLTLLEEKGTVCAKTKGKDMFNDKVYLIPLDNEKAVTTGIGRGTGETCRILPNGHLYYMGFEFERKR